MKERFFKIISIIFIIFNFTFISVKAEEVEYSNVNDFIINDIDGKVTITGYTGQGCTVVIPKDSSIGKITSIGDMAFKDCTSINKLIIMDNIESIGFRSFKGCCNLEIVSMKDNVNTIEDEAFYNCTNLAEIKLSENLIYIKDYMLSNCSNLKKIYIPSKVEYLGEGAFLNCNSLEYVCLPSGINNIGSKTFFGCNNLKNIDMYDNGVKPKVLINSDGSIDRTYIDYIIDNNNSQIKGTFVNKTEIQDKIPNYTDYTVNNPEVNDTSNEENINNIENNSDEKKENKKTKNIYSNKKDNKSNDIIREKDSKYILIISFILICIVAVFVYSHKRKLKI